LGEVKILTVNGYRGKEDNYREVMAHILYVGWHKSKYKSPHLPPQLSKSVSMTLSPSQKRLVFRHFSAFFSYVAPAMRLQKGKN
jgi:hypothetical protein